MKSIILRLFYPNLYKLTREFGTRKAYKEIGVYPECHIPIITQRMRVLDNEILTCNGNDWARCYLIKKFYTRTKKAFDKNIQIVRPLRLSMEQRDRTFFGL